MITNEHNLVRLKNTKYETPHMGYDTQVTVKACGPLVFNHLALSLTFLTEIAYSNIKPNK